MRPPAVLRVLSPWGWGVMLALVLVLIVVIGRGIDDVAILTLTLSGGGLSANDLTRIARTLQTEVAKTEVKK